MVPLLGDFVRRFPHILVDISLTDAVVGVMVGQADVAIRFGYDEPPAGAEFLIENPSEVPFTAQTYESIILRRDADGCPIKRLGRMRPSLPT